MLIEAGDRMHRLTAVRFSHRSHRGDLYWIFVCDCGTEKSILAGNVRRGRTKSCGCKRIENNTTHGMSKHPAYKVWRGMMDRCQNKNDANFAVYGGRGILVCREWHDIERFIADMGIPPRGKTLERINTNKGYSKSNCKWATPKEQQLNRRVSKIWVVHGKEYDDVCTAASELGVTRSHIYHMCSGYKKRGEWVPPVDGCYSKPKYPLN